jgi:predicted pyridoxine 5'-phosphate oxidase superfamily flavin-nucleotide-binding protein
MLTTVAELEAIYGPPFERSITKEISYLNEDYRAFVEASPLVILASVAEEGLDCSPKGDKPGFVRSRLPSAGKMLQRLTAGAIDGATYDHEMPARTQATLY